MKLAEEKNSPIHSVAFWSSQTTLTSSLRRREPPLLTNAHCRVNGSPVNLVHPPDPVLVAIVVKVPASSHPVVPRPYPRLHVIQRKDEPQPPQVLLHMLRPPVLVHGIQAHEKTSINRHSHRDEVSPIVTTSSAFLNVDSGEWSIDSGQKGVGMGKVKFSLGSFFHGTKADLKVGDYMQPGYQSNFEEERVAKYAYFTGTLDAAIWGAELASGKSKQPVSCVHARNSACRRLASPGVRGSSSSRDRSADSEAHIRPHLLCRRLQVSHQERQGACARLPQHRRAAGGRASTGRPSWARPAMPTATTRPGAAGPRGPTSTT